MKPTKNKTTRVSRLWGRCPEEHSWFEIEYPNLDASYRCPACLETAQRVRTTRLRVRVHAKRHHVG